MRLTRDWRLWVLPGASLALFIVIAVSLPGHAVAHFDAFLRAAFHSVASPSLTYFAFAVTFLGSAPFLTGASVSVVVGLWVGRYRREAYAIGVVMTGEVILENGLKLGFARPRPDVFFGVDPSSFSFPSGHALSSICFYGALAFVVGEHSSSAARRITVWVAAGSLIALIGVSRIYIGMHYPSDVFGGYAVGLAWLGALRAAFPGRPATAHSGGLAQPGGLP